MLRTRKRRPRAEIPPPACPIHGVGMLVNRVVGNVQYRYCTVQGCDQSTRTLREFARREA